MTPGFLHSTAPRRLQRLREMSLAEVATRARQKASSWLERARPMSPTWPSPERVLEQRAPALADPAAVARFRDQICDRFFAGATTPGTATRMYAQFGDESADIVAAADRIVHGRFDLLGYELLSFGDPVDWHWDPVADLRAPRCHWSLIDPLDASTLGDSKVIWEVNRHQWLITLGLAYQLTEDLRYARAAGELIDGWFDANPPGIGINWTSSLEVAYRVIAWCWGLALLRDSIFATPERFARIAAAVWAHARHVERYLSVYFSPNTHLTGEALGLFYAGVVFPEFVDASRWRALGQSILATEIDRQVLPDGVNFEQATCYQRYTIEIYLHFAILAARQRLSLPANVHLGIERAVDFLSAISTDGAMPHIGDEDGGWVAPILRRTADDCRGVLAVAAAWSDRPSMAASSGGLAPEVLWLLGDAGAQRLERIKAGATEPRSHAFRSGGYIRMRSPADPGPHELVFDVGPLGCPHSSGHGHADLLSLQCRAFGEAYLVDAGTYSYTPEPAWRDYFRSTSAHSTITVDELSQAEPVGPFAWREKPAARLRSWHSTPVFDFAQAEHDAYGRLPDPVTHRRRVLFVKAGYWIVVDDLLGAREHAIDHRMQLSPRGVVKGPSPWYLAVGSDGGGLWIGAFADVHLDACVRSGDVDPIEGWISTVYGRRRPAPALVYRAAATLPLRIVTVFWPVRSVASLPEIVVRRDGQRFVIAVAATGDTVIVDDTAVRLDR